MFVGHIVAITVGVGVVVALVLIDDPWLIAFYSDEGPSVHLAFPILVEDGDSAEDDVVFRGGDVAIVKSILHGDGFDGHIF